MTSHKCYFFVVYLSINIIIMIFDIVFTFVTY